MTPDPGHLVARPIDIEVGEKACLTACAWMGQEVTASIDLGRATLPDDALLPDDGHLARETGQAFQAVGIGVEDDQVLDAHTGLVVQVNARLNREDRR